MSKRFILHDGRNNSMCADYADDCVFVTTIFEGSETQIALTPEEARSYGEWLIRQADAEPST